MGRIVAIDYGTKRVGVAVTDPLKIIATPLGTYHSEEVISFLEGYHRAENIEKFVIGMPKTLENKPSSLAPMVKGFITLLKKKFPGMAIHTVDERFTSKMAQQTMIAGGSSKKDRRQKGTLDKISATIILQSYLSEHFL